MARPLDGVRVLDFAQVYAGPTSTRILADLGADVIKIEGVKRMDITRNFAVSDNTGDDDYWNRAGYFDFRNGGKKSLTLDFSEEHGGEGVDIVKRLVPLCDVVVESFTPRVMEKFGLDYGSLTALRADIIMLSMSGFGQDGPWRDWSGYGMGLEPASGMSSLTGYRGGDPLRSGISFTDPYTGIVGAGAVLTALAYRRRTGKGQYIDLSEHEAAIPITGYSLMDYAMNGRLPERMGNRSLWYAPQGCYRCKGDDSWLVITVRSDAEWASFCETTGHSEWMADRRFGDVLARFQNHDALDDAISAWAGERDQYEAMHALQKAGIIAAAVLNPKQVLFDEHIKARDMYPVVDTKNHGRRPMPRQVGARFSAFETDSARTAPRLGEHNEEILKGLLGLGEAEVATLKEKGVIGDEPQTAVPLPVMRMFVQWPTTTYLQMGALAALESDYKEQLGIAE